MPFAAVARREGRAGSGALPDQSPNLQPPIEGVAMRILLSLMLLAAVAFAQQPARPAPVPELGANLPAQAVGANDLIAVSVYDAPELSRTIRVDADGLIRLPMIEQRIKAKGLYPADLEAAIGQALRDEAILVDPLPRSRPRWKGRRAWPKTHSCRSGDRRPGTAGSRAALAAGSRAR